jgi:NAD-dependent dihydropyrimidine dehydrogenase PreA subunit
MKISRKIVHIDEDKCNGCGLCVPACAEGAIQIVSGKARLAGEKLCDGLGACLGECPQDAISIIESEAEEFDSAAVEENLRAKKTPVIMEGHSLPCGCPSSMIQEFAPQKVYRQSTNSPSDHEISALTHWPVQIRLVPPSAPFLKNADLLVAADCTPFAYADFHRDFILGKTVLVGCPKLDDAQQYVQKFAEIFSVADIKSVEVVVMEVPCCLGLPVIIKKGMELAGKKIMLQIITISRRGEIIENVAG